MLALTQEKIFMDSSMSSMEAQKKELEGAVNIQLALEDNIGEMIHVVYVDTSSNVSNIVEVSGELVSVQRFNRIIVKSGDVFTYIEFAGINNIISFIEDCKGRKVFQTSGLEEYFSRLNSLNVPMLLEERRRAMFSSSVGIINLDYIRKISPFFSLIRKIRREIFGEIVGDIEERIGIHLGVDAWKEYEKYLDPEMQKIWKKAWEGETLKRQ
jgi:hypothetical protein